jgi:exonuclease III
MYRNRNYFGDGSVHDKRRPLTIQETLDELSEILEKYKNKANILLGGDMNASLRRDSAQDRQFKCFLNENDMKVPPKCTNSATFFHFNGKDTSQIHINDQRVCQL